MQLHNNLKSRKRQVPFWFIIFLFATILFLNNSMGIRPVLALDDASQRILDLRKQIEELTKQSEQYKNNITKSQKQADSLKRQIDILTNQVSNLEIQITITGKQIDATELDLDGTNAEIFKTVNNINDNEKVMAEIINSIYQRENQSLLATLLKNPRLSDFMNEYQQSQNINQKLTGLVVELKTEKALLEEQKQKLEEKKNELETLNQKRTSQKIALDGTKQSKSSLLTTTRGQEARYQQLLTEVEKKKEAFFDELKSLENDAIKSGAFIVHVTATSIPPKGTKIFQWPYEDYRITQGYGMTTYAKRGAYGGSPHNGVDIASGFGSPINPVTAGKILASGFNAGFGNWVAVLHDGGIVSVYAHMRASSGIVNSTPVNISDVIGYEGSTGNSTGSHLHLSIYRDFFTYINPKNAQLYFNYFDGSLNPIDYL